MDWTVDIDVNDFLAALCDQDIIDEYRSRGLDDPTIENSLRDLLADYHEDMKHPFHISVCAEPSCARTKRWLMRNT